ncbi:MAG: helix-turn-helix transcriptional regulator [Eubacteriales bacterium]|nr:helix-turn-helix transcriptional regulator [Eubacteriales bacterium]
MGSVYDFYNLVGKNFKRIRNSIGESQENLADRIDMSRGFISQIESSKVDKGVSLDTLFTIAQEYNIDIREFFEGYEEFLVDNSKNS